MGQKTTTTHSKSAGSYKSAEPVKTIGQMIVEQAQAEIEQGTAQGESFSERLKKLPIKRQRFIWEYVKTGNAQQSALVVGYTPKNAGSAGYEVMQHPEVSLLIKELLQVKFGAPYIMAKFGALSEKAQGENIQLQATDRLARIAGLYDHEPNTNTTGQHLHIHLPKVENKKNIIDVSAKVSEEED